MSVKVARWSLRLLDLERFQNVYKEKEWNGSHSLPLFKTRKDEIEGTKERTESDIAYSMKEKMR